MTTKANYSKGPWTIVEQTEDCERGPYTIEAQSCTVAGDVSGIGIEAYANARLIAAAPAMAEALVWAVRLMNGEAVPAGCTRACLAALSAAGVEVTP